MDLNMHPTLPTRYRIYLVPIGDLGDLGDPFEVVEGPKTMLKPVRVTEKVTSQ